MPAPAVTLPRRGHRPTLLIAGCGDVGLRVLRLLAPRWRVLALTTSPGRCAALRAAGAVPLVGDLDEMASLWRLGALAERVLYLAPPPPEGSADARSRRFARALLRGGRAQRVVYVSTSGVYGDCGGARIDETRAVQPQTDRARRRADAEARWRWFGRTSGAVVTILRVPGIYGAGRAGGARERAARGTPLLAREDDVYTNHIHADDLARACVAALVRGAPQRVVHVSDDSELLMGDYVDLAADLAGAPRPPRVARADAPAHFTPLQWSFMTESRRLDNTRLKRELRLVLRYPTVAEGLREAPR